MDVAKLESWIDAQISSRAPDPLWPNRAAELAVAIEALSPDSTAPELFGITRPSPLPPNAEQLRARAMALLATWPTFLDDDNKAQLGAVMRGLRLDPASIGVTPTPRPGPTTVAHLVVRVPTTIYNVETDEDVTDAAAKRTFAGAHADAEHIPAEVLARAAGGDRSWLRDSQVVLAFDEATNALLAEFSFALSRVPAAAELERFLHVFRNEFFFSGWGLHIEWDGDFPAEMMVSVKAAIADHRIEPVPGV